MIQAISPTEKQLRELLKDRILILDGAMGTMIFYLLMIGATALIIYALVSGSKLSEAQQSLSSIRMDLQQIYSTESDYSGLSNKVALNNGVIPQQLKKGNNIRNGWGGAITLAPNSTNPTMFDLRYEDVPKDACTKFAKFQAGSWVRVTVNGADVSSGNSMVSAISSAVKGSNTVVFVSN
jgi:hypothetical protein